MKSYEFNTSFPDEESCRMLIKQLRDESLTACPHCGGTRLRWIPARGSYFCPDCGRRTALLKGTALERMRITLMDFFAIVQRMTGSASEEAATKTRRAMDRYPYRTVWEAMMKVRFGMTLAQGDFVPESACTYPAAMMPATLGGDIPDNILILLETGTAVMSGEGLIRLSLTSRPVRGEAPPWADAAIRTFKSSLTDTHNEVSLRYLPYYMGEYAFLFNRRGHPQEAFFDVLRALVLAPPELHFRGPGPERHL